MTTNNMEKWDAMKRPPATALKTIKAGRLSGMTDVSPQWRLQVMTEQYGECGIGWYYTVERFWTEPGAAGELMAFVHVHLHTKTPEGWSAPITGIGGSALVAKESAGLRANDEGYKMATTDALSVAMKQLGVAADIYMGLWDGSKYKEQPKEPNKHAPVNAAMQGVVIPDNIMEELRFLASELVDLVEVKNNPSNARDLLDRTRLTEDELPIEGDYLLALSQILAPNSRTRSALKKEGEARRAAAAAPRTLAEAM